MNLMIHLQSLLLCRCLAHLDSCNRPQMKCHPIFHATPRQLIHCIVIKSSEHYCTTAYTCCYGFCIQHSSNDNRYEMNFSGLPLVFFLKVKKSFNHHSVMLVMCWCVWPVMGSCWLSLDTGISHQQL